jgi:hypothetical protein
MRHISRRPRLFKTKTDDTPLNLLSGTVIKTEKGCFYIKNRSRVFIPTHRVFKSWRFYKVVKTTEARVAHYPVRGKLGFREGTLLFCIADGLYYIISGNELHQITSPDTIRNHGLNVMDAFWISKAERDLHKRAV